MRTLLNSLPAYPRSQPTIRSLSRLRSHLARRPIYDRRQPLLFGAPPAPLSTPPPGRTWSGVCFCCASRVTYSKQECFTCPLCQTINDINVPGTPVPPVENSVSAAQVEDLSQQLRSGTTSPPSTNGTNPFLRGPSTPESRLLHQIDAFRSLRSIEASFRDSKGNPPTLKTLALFYGLVTASPIALDALRTRVDAVLLGHLIDPTYPPALLQSKVEMNVSFISLRIGGSLSVQGGHSADWGVIAACRVGALLFAGNERAGLPLATFYCTLLDTLGPAALIESFRIWESRTGQFSLCQYPFMLSLGIKILLLTWDGRRQMEEASQEAVRNTMYGHRPQNPLLIIRIRRSNLVQDSLRQISSFSGELKKSLKIVFEGEEGLDAGGLRKEWFLLLCRQLFDPQFGMFQHDEDSNLCWFNPASLDANDEFYLVGCAVALAIYNSAVFKKLKGEAVGLADLAVIRPALAKGLQGLLDFDGDVAEVFCRTFVGEVEAWGEVQEVPLMPGGANVTVTNSNRGEFVKRYCDFLLNTSVSSQFQAFAHGFAEVTEGNSFSLFRGEELELLGFSGEHDPTVRYVLLPLPSLTDMGNETERFPQSHTCFNELSLYRYRDARTMESRLVRAMEESEGFGLR
ncbi:hypothetical protein RQP46_000395 [Phenoliferia psychrophenolica]